MKALVLAGCALVAACSPVQRAASSPEAEAELGTEPDGGLAEADYRVVVNAPDRLSSDREIDPGRHPVELLSFLGIQRGMRVGELFAGAGYTAELIARAVGPSGTVYAQNPNVVLQQVEGQFTRRLARAGARQIVRVDRELETPFPPELTDLDMVVFNLAYHDTVWLGVDRDRMNRGVFSALKHGGRYVIMDHSARQGRGIADAQDLHRVDEALVREEVARAGFVFEREGKFLRNARDSRDWNDSPGAAGPRRGSSDRFALVYVKP
jgi:predicted methyltransferase